MKKTLGVISIFKLEEMFDSGSSSYLEREKRRLTELYKLDLINTPNEESFDRITRLASRIFQVPISLITLLTEDKQWFKSCVGLTGSILEERSTEREAAFCQYVVLDGNPLVIEDTLEDHRFKHNRLVKEHQIRFYAGVPIITKQNNILGSLCIIDVKPRTLSEDELNKLIDLSYWVKTEIELRSDIIERTLSEQSIRSLYEITSNNDLSFEHKLKKLLSIGCERFQLSDGNISKITGNHYEVIQTTDLTETINVGEVISLDETCAGMVRERLTPVHISQSAPIHNQSMIREYVGAPIFVHEQFYGTFCFYDIHQGFRTISNSDIEFLQLMTQWVGNELERRIAEKKLKETQERFEQIANNIKEAFWIVDIQEKKLLYMSSAWKEISGRTGEEYNLDQTLWERSIHPDDREYALERFGNVHERVEFDYRIIHTDGTIRWVRNRIVPVYNPNGHPYRIAGVAEDITEKKQNQALVRKSDKLTAVGQLAASIAHEIRNPLTSIKGFMQLKDGYSYPYKELILSELLQMEDFVNEILVLANSHLGTKREQNNIIDLLQEVLRTNEELSRMLNITFCIKCHASLSIPCDLNQVKLVFQNLISNAIESMPKGGMIHIEIGIEDERYLYIAVADEGVGISPERIPTLGEPFYSNKEKGSGLGLMISYRIIQNHKGKIFFTSELGKGTTVKILLPLE